MKPMLLLLVLIAGAAPSMPSAKAVPACGSVAVSPNVVVPAGGISLADLLAPGACPAVRRDAAKLSLGSAPLTGSVRVLRGAELRERLEALLRRLNRGLSEVGTIEIPERVIIRRSGRRASCAGLGTQVLAMLGPSSSASESSPPEFACDVAERIPADAPLEVIRSAWDAAQQSWNIFARCRNRATCVPFRVRVRDGDFAPGETARTEENAGAAAVHDALQARFPAPDSRVVLPVVRPGGRVLLSWYEGGIRILVPAVCLDRGASGETVRVRIARGGRELRAIVVGPGMLEAAS